MTKFQEYFCFLNVEKIGVMNELKTKLELNRLSEAIIAAAIRVHKRLGPGLLESSYETCLEYELRKKEFFVERQKKLPLSMKRSRLRRDIGWI